MTPKPIHRMDDGSARVMCAQATCSPDFDGAVTSAIDLQPVAKASAERGAPGFVHVYTGDGKGKTTAAFGLALRAAGHGLRVYVGQFMKSEPYGEIAALEGHHLVAVEQYGSRGCIRRHEVTDEHVDLARLGLQTATRKLTSGEWDVVVLDEICTAVLFSLVSTEDVLRLMKLRPPLVELILTGRQAPDAVVTEADLVTEMREVKHYYRNGVLGRSGIDF